jgi:hypothetical protein
MAAVRKVCRITMDTSVDAAMNVHRKDGTIMKFKEYKSGLYYYNHENKGNGRDRADLDGKCTRGALFMPTTTERRLSQQQWDDIPMSDGIIAAVEAMAEEQEQPLLNNGGPVFEWIPWITIADEAEGRAIVDLDEPGADGDDESTEGGEPDESDKKCRDGNDAEGEEEANEDGKPETEGEKNAPGSGGELILPEEENEGDEDVDASTSNSGTDGVVNDELTDDDVEDGAEDTEAEDPSHGSGRYKLRPKRERRYDDRLARAMDNPSSNKSYDAQFLQQAQQETTGLSSLREAVKELYGSGSGTKVVEYVTGLS